LQGCRFSTPLAFAQTAERGERIEVTGTRIPSPNIESTSPVAVVYGDLPRAVRRVAARWG
jgi:hypothetical protein